MKNINNKTVKTQNAKQPEETKKITREDLDPVELAAMERLAMSLAVRRAIKDLFEEDDDERKPRGILSELLGKDDDDEDIDPFDALDDDDEDEDEDEEEASATNEFLREHYTPNHMGRYMSRPRAKCADGYSVSIQAGTGAGVMCWPHEDTDKFTHVMLNTPSVLDEELLPYRMDLNDDHEIFFFFVPVEVVDKVLEKHGGIVGTEKHNLTRELLRCLDY